MKSLCSNRGLQQFSKFITARCWHLHIFRYVYMTIKEISKQTEDGCRINLIFINRKESYFNQVVNWNLTVPCFLSWNICTSGAETLNQVKLLPSKGQQEFVLAILFTTWTLGSTLQPATRYSTKVRAVFFILYS